MDKKYFDEESEEGYFIWVKKSLDRPLITCISISSKNVSQNPVNLVMIEKDVKARIYSICNAIKKDLCGNHAGSSKIILKENSKLEMKHFHKWGKGDVVTSSTGFFLEKKAELAYAYRCLEVQ
jgi:Fe-S cluster assembly scaffold protein SufB